MTYSEHGASTRKSAVYYFVIFSIHMFLLYMFVVKWFVPTFNLPSAFVILLTAGILGQLAALIVPSTGGRNTVIHEITAYFMHILLAPLCLLITFQTTLSPFARIFGLMAAVYMMFIWFFLGFSKHIKRRRPRQLIWQTFYGLSFHATLLLATYVR